MTTTIRSLTQAQDAVAFRRDDLRWALKEVDQAQRRVNECKRQLAQSEAALKAVNRFKKSVTGALKDIPARQMGSPLVRLEQAKHLLKILGATFYNDRSRKGRSIKVQYWPREKATARLLNRALTRLADDVNERHIGRMYRGAAQPLDDTVRRYHFHTAAGDPAHEAKNEELRDKARKARAAAKRRAARERRRAQKEKR